MRPVYAAAAVLLAAPLLPAAAAGAAAVTLQQPWYYTEVVIFQRPGVLEHAGEESLVRHRGARLPRTLRLLADDPLTRPAPLDPLTRLCLTYPVLTLRPPATTLWDDELAATADAEPRDRRPVPGIEPRLSADPKLDYLRQLRTFENRLVEQSYRWLPADTFTLRRHAERLSRGGYQLLLHGRWLQPAPAREAPEALLLRAGLRDGDSYALEGTVDVTVARFLHFRAHLTYREPLLGRAPVDWAFAPRGEGPPEGPPAMAAAPLRGLQAADLVPDGYLLLDESRRMRSGELHYLDHPKLGILVRIEPVEIPAELSETRQALEEGR